MRKNVPYFIASAAIAMSGCIAVHEARVTQRELAPAGLEAAAPVSAGKLDLRGLSLEGLVMFALTNRPSVASAELAVEDARLALKAIAADAPVLSGSPLNAFHLSASVGYNASSPTARRPDRLSSRTRGSAAEALSLDLLIWDFGRYDARARAQSERVVASELALLQAGYSVLDEVCTAYFGVLEKDALLAVAQSNECEYAEHLQQAEDMLAAGEAKNLDVLRARLDLATAMEVTVAAANDVVTAGARLLSALGVDASRGTREDVMAPLPRPMAMRRRAFPDTEEDVGAAFAFARTNAPTVKIARAKLRAASADVDYAIADMLPEVRMSASLDWTNPLWYWRWGASGVQSLLTGGRRTAAVERATVAMRAAACELDEVEQELSLSIELAVAERDNARSALGTAEVSVQRARENLHTVREQFALGEAGRVEYAEAVSAHASALGARVKAFYRGQVAEARLLAIEGRVPVFEEKTISREPKKK